MHAFMCLQNTLEVLDVSLHAGHLWTSTPCLMSSAKHFALWVIHSNLLSISLLQRRHLNGYAELSAALFGVVSSAYCCVRRHVVRLVLTISILLKLSAQTGHFSVRPPSPELSARHFSMCRVQSSLRVNACLHRGQIFPGVVVFGTRSHMFICWRSNVARSKESEQPEHRCSTPSSASSTKHISLCLTQ